MRHIVEQLGASSTHAVDVVIPQDHFAGIVESRLYLNSGGRSECVVEELIGTAPGKLDGLAGFLSYLDRLDGLVVVDFAAESAPDEWSNNADVLSGHIEIASQLPLKAERRLS